MYITPVNLIWFHNQVTDLSRIESEDRATSIPETLRRYTWKCSKTETRETVFLATKTHWLDFMGDGNRKRCKRLRAALGISMKQSLYRGLLLFSLCPMWVIAVCHHHHHLRSTIVSLLTDGHPGVGQCIFLLVLHTLVSVFSASVVYYDVHILIRIITDINNTSMSAGH